MECEKCNSRWDLEVHIPKILHCGHTVCKACLMKLINESNSSENSSFKCPVCQDESKSLKSKEDISNLKENQQLISLSNTLEQKKKEISRISSSISQNSNESNNNNLKESIKSLKGINNCYFPICEIHKSKANFFHKVNNKIEYICSECIKIENYEDLEPMPNLVRQNEIKINACKNKVRLLYDEIDKIENFLKNYQIQFEQVNKKKIDSLFDYIKKIIEYNRVTVNTLYNQCKNEQQIQINQKIDELNLLRKELADFEYQLKEFQNDKLFQSKPNPQSQTKLEKVYNKLANYINYENELNLFQIDFNVHEDIKESLFNLIQNAYEINVDYLKMENGELPRLKILLNKSTSWPCICGKKDNQIGKILCQQCMRYRPLETYNNILFNPLMITKDELNEFQYRRKHEGKVFISMLKKNDENKNQKRYKLYAIDMKWFNSWKTYVLNNMDENIMSNNDKYISDNKLIGVLPPGKIDNTKICFKLNNEYQLKPGLKIKQDFCVINEFLWEWLKLVYCGGPQIVMPDTYDNYDDTLLKKYSDKSDSVIENNGSVFTFDSKGSLISNEKENINEPKNIVYIRDSINKINKVDIYNFKPKFL